MLLSDTLEYVGISKGDYIIKANNRKVLNGVLESMNIQETSIRDAILRTVDKFDKVGESGIRQLLGKGRLDASGAYIDGVGLSDTEADVVVAFLTSKGSNIETTLSNLKNLIGSSDIGLEGVNELETMAELFEAGGYGSSKISIDPSVVRGLGYYTGTIVEVSSPKDFSLGSIGGGGRYDDLVQKNNPKLSGFGISFGFDRIFLILEELNLFPNLLDSSKSFLFLNFGTDKISNFIDSVNQLRKDGIVCEIYPDDVKIKKQLDYANKKGIDFVVIIGDDELKKDLFKVKDMSKGEESTYKEIDSLAQKIKDIS